MKRIFFVLVLIMLVFTSCKKFLDTVPDGSLEPGNAYASAAQINAAITGMYTNLKYVVGFAEYYTAYYTAPTDESYHYNTANAFASFAAYASDNTTGNPNSNLWRGCYQSINYCNSLLDNIDASSKGKVDSSIVRRAKGEALFLRAFHYFILAQFYGDIPMSLKATSDPTESQIARTPVKEVYNQIIDDLTQADTMLYDRTFSSQGYTDRITRTGVQAIAARACMFAAGAPVNDTRRYADALAWCKKVVASGQHSLISSYPKVFIDEAQNIYNQENIFEIGFNRKADGEVSAGGGIGVYVGPSMGSSNGTTSAGATAYDSGYVFSYLKLHPRLYFKYEPGDTRRDWNIANYTNTTAVAYASLPATSPGFLSFGPTGVGIKIPIANNRFWTRQPAKWRREFEPALSRGTQRTSSTNFPVIRYSDVLLMLAEAENEVNGPTAVAYDAINQVRRRAISSTPIVDSITFVQGSGYNYAPDSISYNTGGGTGFSINVIYNSAAKTVQVLLTGRGSGFTTAPTVAIGRPWRSGIAYTAGTQVAAPNGRLYTVAIGGTSTTTAPTNTSGSSSASSTGAVFTYAGVACTVTAYLSETPTVDYTSAVLASKGISFKQAIMDERARELCFEALRLGDLKRWGILIPTIQGLAADISGTNPLYPRLGSAVSELGTNNDAPAWAPVNNVGLKDMFYPIPQWDLNLNRKLTQNPGY